MGRLLVWQDCCEFFYSAKPVQVGIMKTLKRKNIPSSGSDFCTEMQSNYGTVSTSDLISTERLLAPRDFI